MSRTVNGERLFDDVAKEVLRKQLWQIADYCGVEVLTYAILSNHFHVLIRIPTQDPIDDAELLRRYAILYPKPTRYQTARLEVIKGRLAAADPEAESWRQQQRALMGDVSAFMKLLKQRFSVWYNRTHQRYGTLWSERFKSVLVENAGNALRTIAAYIDLNAVRAGLVVDPAEYRFHGYGEAVAGQSRARRGLLAVTGGTDLRAAHAHYRELLYGKGSRPVSGSAELDPTTGANGGMSLATVLRHRIRYFSNGAVLGSQAFVAEHQRRWRTRQRCSRILRPHPLPPTADWQGLCAWRNPRAAGSAAQS